MTSEQALILVVDDNEMNRDMLSRRLERQGYRSIMAEDGVQALEVLPQHPFDLILLDIMMPRMNGYEVLEKVKNDPAARHIPIIMISAVDDLDSVVKCVEMGADDYLFKPFNPILLKARVSASLEKKRLRDQEQIFLKQAQSGGDAATSLLPSFVADRVRAGHESVVDSFAEATVLVAGVGGLGDFGSPLEMVDLLNRAFAEFDRLVAERGLFRVRTNGNTYVVAGDVPHNTPDAAKSVLALTLDMRMIMSGLRLASGGDIGLIAGVHTGAAVGGLIRAQNYDYYDLWGEAISIAGQLQSRGSTEAVEVSASVYRQTRFDYVFEEYGKLDLKGVSTPTYLLKGRL